MIITNIPNYIDVHCLSYKHEEKTIFSDLSFKLNEGKSLNISGKNGSGKTSLSKIIAGLNQANSGLLKTSDGLVAAMISHSIPFKNHCSLFDNLKFWAAVYQQNQITIEHAFSFFRLAPCLKQKFAVLSSGQKKRADLCRLILNTKAKIWLLDEAESNLDYDGLELLNSITDDFLNTGGMVIKFAPNHKQPNLNLDDYQK